MPGTDELLDKEVGVGLRVVMPLVLYSHDGRTRGLDQESFSKLQARLSDVFIEPFDASDESHRVATVIILWNVLRHFYPYFDVVGSDWERELSTALSAVLAVETEADLSLALREMTAKLEDGHARVANSKLDGNRAWFPFRVDWIDDRVVVVESTINNVERGDIILAVDDVPAVDEVKQRERYISGSRQWKRHLALESFGWGEEGAVARLTLSRHGRELETDAPRDTKEAIVVPRPAMIQELEDGIHYVDLTVVSMEEIEPVLIVLAQAKGIVFDLRGYPAADNHKILQHLTATPLRSAKWQIPQIIYPDQERLVGYDTSGRWSLEPRQPRLHGEIVFLTNAAAISYAESIMGIVEHYGLGEIIGQPTAGANGNVNSMNLFGSFRVSWTGMRVLKHDDSQHHLVGIRPTIPVERTTAGVLQGRDELIEKGIEIIKSRIPK